LLKIWQITFLGSILNKNYIFTVTNGRSGQATLHKILQENAINCISGFEEPSIKPIFPFFIGDLEKKIRRRFFESNELLGRGNIIKAYENKNYEYIKKTSIKRLKLINKQLRESNANCYFDISKFYIRGLYKGFNFFLKNLSIVFLVRDPLENMKSFLNRNKNFFLDNSSPLATSNILNLDCKSFSKGELYLWSWAETFLRYQELSKKKKIKKSLVFYSEDLKYPDKVSTLLKRLGVEHKKIKQIKRINTNEQLGLNRTKVETKDLLLLKEFIFKIPKKHKLLIRKLELSLNKNKKKYNIF